VVVKVVPKLVLGDEHGVEELLNSQIAGVQVREDFADEIHQLLDLEDMAFLLAFHHQSRSNSARGGSGVEEQSSPTEGEVWTGGVVKKSFNLMSAS
jgi:hypothetical protein